MGLSTIQFSNRDAKAWGGPRDLKGPCGVGYGPAAVLLTRKRVRLTGPACNFFAPVGAVSAPAPGRAAEQHLSGHRPGCTPPAPGRLTMRLPHLFGPATRPFSFFGCLELREILGRRARDERELMEGLEQIPAGSIYYHTHSIFLRHPHIGGGYPNDFANWVATQVGDKGLAERLAVVDPYRLATVEELREEPVSVVESHIATLQPVPRCVFGDPFFFV